MKTLTLVFQNPDTPQVIELMRRTFEEVFLHSVRVEVCYMDRIGEAEQLRADVLVVNRTVSLLALRPHASSFRNVVFMTRSIRKKYLEQTFWPSPPARTCCWSTTRRTAPGR